MTKVPADAPAPSTDAARLTLLDRLMRARLTRRFFGLALVQRILSPARGDRAVHKFIRYSMVSAVAIVISQGAILICTALFHTSGILANTIGAFAATPASYELNRKWAWGKHGKSHLWREVAPFWGLTLVGYLASTGTVQLADNLCRTHDVTGLSRSLAIMGASLLAYGIVWIGKFLIIQHLMFGHGGTAVPPGVATPARDDVGPVTASGTEAGNGGGGLLAPTNHGPARAPAASAAPMPAPSSASAAFPAFEARGGTR